MTMKIRAQWHADPAHEWLVVSRAAFDRIGLTEANITPWSYRSGDQIALEGDCDAEKFTDEADRLVRRGAIEIVYDDAVMHDGDAPIRKWSRFGTLDC